MKIVVITIAMLKEDKDTEVLRKAIELYVKREELNAVVGAQLFDVPKGN